MFIDELRKLHRPELITIPPHLVADTPILYIVGGWMPIYGTQMAHPGVRLAVAVLHQILRAVGIAEPCIYRDVGFGSQEPAQVHKLIRAHIVGLNGAPNGIIRRRSPVRIPDGIAPFVGRDEISTGEPVHRSMQLLQRPDYLRPKAI